MARRHCGCPHDAEDVVSEAFIRIATWPVTDDNRLDQLAVTVVRRLCVDELRRRRREADSWERCPRPLDPAGPDALAVDGDLVRRVVRGLAAVLTAAELRVVLLAADGLDHRSIASDLGISTRASQVALSRARGKIRHAWPARAWPVRGWPVRASAGTGRIPGERRPPSRKGPTGHDSSEAKSWQL